MRELLAMAEARQRECWNHTAALLAMTANVHRDPKRGRSYRVTDFHPLLTRKSEPERPAFKGDLRMLKTIFVDRRA